MVHGVCRARLRHDFLVRRVQEEGPTTSTQERGRIRVMVFLDGHFIRFLFPATTLVGVISHIFNAHCSSITRHVFIRSFTFTTSLFTLYFTASQIKWSFCGVCALLFTTSRCWIASWIILCLIDRVPRASTDAYYCYIIASS